MYKLYNSYFVFLGNFGHFVILGFWDFHLFICYMCWTFCDLLDPLKPWILYQIFDSFCNCCVLAALVQYHGGDSFCDLWVLATLVQSRFVCVSVYLLFEIPWDPYTILRNSDGSATPAEEGRRYLQACAKNIEAQHHTNEDSLWLSPSATADSVIIPWKITLSCVAHNNKYCWIN